MKVFYQEPDGSAAGPVPHARLVFMLMSGEVGLSTLALHEGETSWQPLARLLSWQVADGLHGSAEPVSLAVLEEAVASGSLSPDTWVAETGGSDWRLLRDVLAACGNVLSPGEVNGRSGLPGRMPQIPARPYAGIQAAPASVRQMPKLPRPPQLSVDGPRPIPVAGSRLNGIGRLHFFLWHLGFAITIAVGAALLAVDFNQQLDAGIQAKSSGHGFVYLTVIGIFIAIGSCTVCCLRLQSTGFSRILAIPLMVGIGLNMLPAGTGASLWKLILLIDLYWIGLVCILLVLPAGVRKTRRMDAQGWTNCAILVLLLVGIVLLGIEMTVILFEELRQLRPAGRS